MRAPEHLPRDWNAYGTLKCSRCSWQETEKLHTAREALDYGWIVISREVHKGELVTALYCSVECADEDGHPPIEQKEGP